MATTDIYTVMGGLVPYRNCLRFLGGDVDDGVQVDTLAAAIVAGNHTKGTITAWIMIPDVTGTYTIFGAGNSAAVEYMEFKIVAGKLNFKVVDTGPSTRVDVSTTSVVLQAHKWHHVALVQDGQRPAFYVDGVRILDSACTYATSTEVTQWFDDMDTVNGGHIGCSDSVAGGALLTNEFKGYISNVKVWSNTASTAALTAQQVLDDMNGISYTTTLLAHYTFYETVVNQANPATYDGTIVGALIYCQACEFTSRLSFGCGTPVVADSILISTTDNLGIACVVQAA